MVKTAVFDVCWPIGHFGGPNGKIAQNFFCQKYLQKVLKKVGYETFSRIRFFPFVAF